MSRNLWGIFKIGDFCQVWWHTSLVSALGRQRQVGLCKSEVSLIYRVNTRPARAT